MFYVQYLLAEVRRRRGRTALTALGLAVGVGLVVIVGALSKGLDDAQEQVLEPLTGVGTDLAVSRPLLVSGDDPAGRGTGDPFSQLSDEDPRPRRRRGRRRGPVLEGLARRGRRTGERRGGEPSWARRRLRVL